MYCGMVPHGHDVDGMGYDYTDGADHGPCGLVVSASYDGLLDGCRVQGSMGEDAGLKVLDVLEDV